MLHVVDEPFVRQNDHFDDKGGDEEEMYDAELVTRKFSEAFDAYKAEILRQHAENPQVPAMTKAMMVFTGSMKRSLKCKPLTMESQMHNFVAGTLGKSKTKHCGVINVLLSKTDLQSSRMGSCSSWATSERQSRPDTDVYH